MDCYHYQIAWYNLSLEKPVNLVSAGAGGRVAGVPAPRADAHQDRPAQPQQGVGRVAGGGTVVPQDQEAHR